MSDLQAIDLDPFLTGLFWEMRRGGMALTLEQCNWLRAAVAKGYGLGGWEDLERICRCLWVRPTPDYAEDKFVRAFQSFQERHQLKKSELTTPSATPNSSKEMGLPRVPPRQSLAPTVPPTEEERKAPVAIKVEPPARLSPQGRKDFQLIPRDFPIGLAEAKVFWSLLRHPHRSNLELEVDLEATLGAIQRQGHFSDVVLRPVRTRRCELVFLADDSNGMIPFRPAIETFLQAIARRWIGPARVHRFTSYPEEYLYDWQQPLKAESLAKLLSQWHPDRTIAIVWSDGGAASGLARPERIRGTQRFLQRLRPCVRQVIWVNPLPPHRWRHTSAEAINRVLNGQMGSWTPASLRAIVRHQLSERRG